jgi:hypothetical protein
MPRDEGDRGRDAAVCHRDAGVRRRRDPGRHAGHDLERDPCGGERLRFLAAASEHERIAPLQPHHALALATQLHEERIDRLLAGRVGAATALADLEHRHAWIHAACRTHDRRIGQRIGGDDVAARQQVATAHRDEARIARPRADEVDDACTRVAHSRPSC